MVSGRSDGLNNSRLNTSFFLLNGGEQLEYSRRTDDTHWIGIGPPEEMRKAISLKEIVAFNERQLKLIEYNNMQA